MMRLQRPANTASDLRLAPAGTGCAVCSTSACYNSTRYSMGLGYLHLANTIELYCQLLFGYALQCWIYETFTPKALSSSFTFVMLLLLQVFINATSY
jgi:hypothetical protein